MSEPNLTLKQSLFVKEYLVDLNASQAAIRAGYSPDSAGSIGWENLQKPEIAAEIERQQKARSHRTEVTADKVVRELARIAFLDSRNVMTWGPDGVTFKPSTELTEDDAACIVEASETVTKDGGTIRVKMADKLTALALLAKHTGVTKDQLELSGPGGGPIGFKEVVIEHHVATAPERDPTGEDAGRGAGPGVPSGAEPGVGEPFAIPPYPGGNEVGENVVQPVVATPRNQGPWVG